MLISRSNFNQVLSSLHRLLVLSCDTETTGLSPYTGDRLFSIIISSGEEDFYFNFNKAPDTSFETLLNEYHKEKLKELFGGPDKTWFFHNAKFDLAMLKNEGIGVLGKIHCTRIGAKLLYNDYLDYSLDACANRIGMRKDDRVMEYIKENKLAEKILLDGKKTTKEILHYERVPLEFIQPYGEKDARVTYHLGCYQKDGLEEIGKSTPSNAPNIAQVIKNEEMLIRTVERMERTGLAINIPYCHEAIGYEHRRLEEAKAEFKRITGRDYLSSNKLFSEVFASEKNKWSYTKKENPSFKSEIIEFFDSLAAKEVIKYRAAKSNLDFYNTFIFYSDKIACDLSSSLGIIHPNLDQAGTGTGRFSSSTPNFQNLKKDDEEEIEKEEFVVRRAVVPRPGQIFVMLDYDQMEYKLMLDYAARMTGRRTALVDKVLNGEDFHQATADLVNSIGIHITRKQAKSVNFAILYGAGDEKLSLMLKSTIVDASKIRKSIARIAPEITYFAVNVAKAAKRRGFVFNWFGRRYQFPDSRFCYRAPNYVIQGGCADVVKIAMNKIDDFLLDKKSKLILQIHDELVIEVDKSEINLVPKKVKEIMETSYPFHYVPLTVSMEWSNKSLADKIDGFPKEEV